MAEFIAPAQVLAIGDTVAFAGTTKRCANVVHKDGSGIFALKGGKSCCNPAKYVVLLHVVVTATAATPVELQIYVDGEPVGYSLISMVPAAVGNVVSGTTAITVEGYCCVDRISVRAMTVVPLTSANIIINRVA